MTKRYVVRELPYRKGTRQRQIERVRYFHDAKRLAERVSDEGRAVAVEMRGVQLGLWVNGQQVFNS